MSSKSDELCRFFVKGKVCRYGDSCRFKHINSQSVSDFESTEERPSIQCLSEGSIHETNLINHPNASEAKRKQGNHSEDVPKSRNCQYYAKFKYCRFGQKCWFDHEIGSSDLERSDSSVPLDLGTDIVVSEPAEKFVAEPAGNQHRTRTTSTENSSRSENDGKICTFYAKFKRCAYGKRCRFQHEFVPRGASPNTSEAGPVSHEPQLPVFDGDDKQEYTDAAETYDSGRGMAVFNMKEDKNGSRRNICTYFAKFRHCRYGRTCRFQHSVLKGSRSDPLDMKKLAKRLDESEDQVQKQSLQSDITQKKTKTFTSSQRRLCPYFKSGDCRRGGKCRYWHPQDIMDDIQMKVTDKEQNITELKYVAASTREGNAPQNVTQRVPVRPTVQKLTLRKSEVTEDSLQKLRQTEIEQMKKRFPKEKFSILDETPELFQCRLSFCSSDPDWPYDVKAFDLLILVPEHYPEQILTVCLPADQDLPETVRRYVEVSIQEWLSDRKNNLEKQEIYEMMFRPFLRWLDKSLETIVTEALRQMKREMAAKAAGFEFISASQLKAAYNLNQGSDSDSGSGSESEKDGEVDAGSGEDVQEESSTNHADTVHESKERDGCILETEVKGTEMMLRNLQLKEGAATMMFTKICIIIQCGRCKNRMEFNTPGGRLNSIPCTKCNLTQIVRFRPVLIHQFSSVLGYLDLENCVPFDLVFQESQVSIGCLNCSKENKTDGLAPGQVLDLWCHQCHQKMRVAAESVRFTHLQPSIVTDQDKMHHVSLQKAKRVAKDPAIQEGKPLPGFGTCKHFKKSFRWLRFPCCGKAYPCDVCHDEKEMDHEMKFANRMICGFCCKEQVFASERPCVACQQMMTKGSSAHWEGGQGCRNKLRMSKNDNQKYSSMSKTISKHAQKLKEIGSKKKVKLHHA